MKKLLLISAILMITATLSAQIIHVPADQPTIQAGIDAANNGDTVLVAENTYYENVRFMGKAITLASHYIMDGDTNHINNTIIDGSQAINPDSAACVMFVHDEDTTSILNGFTISGGSGVWTTGLNVRAGGGVFGYDAGAKIINNKIMYNQVESDSAGGTGLIFLGGDNYWVVIDNNTISHNTSISHGYSAFGGGMSILVNAVIKNNIIEHNTCTNDTQGADGGGIELELWSPNSNQYAYVYNNIIRYNELIGSTNAMGGGIMSLGAMAVIENNIIEGNTAIAPDVVWGGGIATHSSVDGIIIISNKINNNSIEADQAYGGGINLYNNGMTRIENNEFMNNSGYGYSFMAGGALRIHTTKDSMLIRNNRMYNNMTTSDSHTAGGAVNIYPAGLYPVIFSQNKVGNNEATYGGGLRTFDAFNISIINNLFIENEANAYGGAIYFQEYSDDNIVGIDNPYEPYIEVSYKSGSSSPVVINNTFRENISNYRGGAIYSDHTEDLPIILNSIFWENEATNAGNAIYGSQLEDIIVSYSDIDTLGIAGNWEGKENINEDPLFIPGDTMCHINGGPCHNTGINELEVGGVTYFAPDIDYDGDPRPQGDYWDIGADECLMIGISNNFAESSLLDLKTNPNPTSGILNISYKIEANSSVNLCLMNMQGELLDVFVPLEQTPGKNSQRLNISHLSDGLYLVRLQVGDKVEIAKIILMKK